MQNKILISMEEDYEEPSWLCNVEPFVQKALDAIGYDGEEISILFCRDPFIKDLNKKFRGIDAPTDVLSFENGTEYTDENGNNWFTAGDIVISLETLEKNAQYFDVHLDEELRRLLVHGLLHLNGYEHGEEHIQKDVEPECEMLKIQKDVMIRLSNEKII